MKNDFEETSISAMLPGNNLTDKIVHNVELDFKTL